MSPRTQRPEQEFGSDSFLDVIANIVGILIILIVVVGMKVARQPTEVTPAETAAQQAIAEARQVREESTRIMQEEAASRRQVMALRQQQLQEVQQQQTVSRTELEALQQRHTEQSRTAQRISGDQQLTSLKLASLQQQLDRAEKQKLDIAQEKQQLAQLITRLSEDLQQKESEVAGVQQAVSAAAAQQQVSESAQQKVTFETQQLREVLQNLEVAQEPADRLQHRLSPVSEAVEEGELHFRVDKDRISHVPLEDLLDRLKTQVQSRRSAVTRFSRYEGAVGPVGGYRMSYVVERDMSPLDAVQHGSGTFRVSVSRWTITADPSLEAEPVEIAVRPGSRFRQLVETAPPGSAVTFWIYPDSFTNFPALREVAHGLQLRVAARPLPEGTDIVGSPGGSRSSAQ